MEYLKDPLDRDDLARIIAALEEPPAYMVRRDTAFDGLGLGEGNLAEAGAVVDLLLEHPVLMQRPVGLLGDRAVVARPSERILDLLDD